jgi:hypothetical protein
MHALKTFCSQNDVQDEVPHICMKGVLTTVHGHHTGVSNAPLKGAGEISHVTTRAGIRGVSTYEVIDLLRKAPY